MSNQSEVTAKSIEVLESCASIFENKPEAWCQGYYAKTANNENCSFTDSAAAQWCAIGAIEACTQALYRNSDFVKEQCHFAIKSAGVKYNSIVIWNDQKGQSAKVVAQKFYEAAQLLRESLLK